MQRIDSMEDVDRVFEAKFRNDIIHLCAGNCFWVRQALAQLAACIDSGNVKCQTNRRNIWLTNREWHLQIKKSEIRDKAKLGMTIVQRPMNDGNCQKNVTFTVG